MGMNGDTALALAKSYVKKTLQGQGALKGQDGFSPTITENADNTDKIYKLDITTADSSFTTPNLRGKDGEGSGGETNVIGSISVNGTPISVDENKNVDITVPSIDGLAKTEDIPTKVSELTNDSNYQTAEQVNNTVVTEISKVVADAPEDFDTLKEMSDWIAGHEDDASAMNSAISDNKTAIAALQKGKADKSEIPTTVAELSDSADYAKTADIPTTLPANGGNANTVNNHTVETDVPTDAVFTDTIYDDTEVKESIDELNSNLCASNAGAHNAIYRGKDLTNVYTKDQIYAMINAGTFDDLFIGDFFDILIAGEGGNETVRCILAGFDTYLHNGDTSFEAHHAVIVTKNCLTTTHGMNPTSTTEGGFQGSDMWNTVLPIYNTAFGNVFGSHLLSHKTLLTNSISASGASMAGAGYTGYSNNWSWVDTKLSLLSEIQVYGVNVFSSSFFDTGCDNLQLPLFALDPTAKACRKSGTANADASNRQWYWLRNVASATSFAGVYYHGNVEFSNPSYSLGVRPLFCIG